MLRSRLRSSLRSFCCAAELQLGKSVRSTVARDHGKPTTRISRAVSLLREATRASVEQDKQHQRQQAMVVRLEAEVSIPRSAPCSLLLKHLLEVVSLSLRLVAYCSLRARGWWNLH